MGFSKMENWYKDGHESAKSKQIEVIRKHYPNYSETDWVLWIVADLCHKYDSDIVGTIKIRKKDGRFIDRPLVLRTPYRNKIIRQLSMKSGRKRLYGIPLVFDTFEELNSVSDVEIRWDIYEQWSLEGMDQPLDLHVTSVVVDYQLYFEKNDSKHDHRFFTLFSKDSTAEHFTTNSSADEYYNEFDLAMNANGNILCYDDEWEFLTHEIITLKRDNVENITNELTSDEKTLLDKLYQTRPDRAKTYEHLSDTVVDSEVQWHLYGYKKTETLKSEYMADLLIP
jgi:hypothetical protein